MHSQTCSEMVPPSSVSELTPTIPTIISSRRHQIEVGSRMTTDQHCLSGYVASATNILITFPINKTVFRQRLHGVNAVESVRQLQAEGFLNLYRGIFPPLMQKSVQMSIMFGSYNAYTKWFQQAGCRQSSSKVMAAGLAGATEALLSPFERVQTLMMDHKNTHTFKNTPHAFQFLRQHYGFKEYYRGLTAILLRNGPSNVIFFCCRDKLGRRLPRSLHPMLVDFTAGASLGAFISTVFYPINTTKTHMMKTWGGKFRSFHSVFSELLRERGLRGLFRGSHVNCSRAFISWGIINLVQKYIERICRWKYYIVPVISDYKCWTNRPHCPWWWQMGNRSDYPKTTSMSST